MKRWALLIVALLLAGCSDPAAAPEPAAPPPDASPVAPASPLNLTLETSAGSTQTAAFTVSGSVEREASITLTSGSMRRSFTANGSWSASLELKPGLNAITVAADAGAVHETATLDVVRVMPFSVQVTYRGDIGMEDRNDTFWFDITARLSRQSGAYDGCSQQHPGHANVHDALIGWTLATGHGVTYGDCGDFGVSVEAIEGHESPGFWCYEINGEAAEFGITLQEVSAGDVVSWDDCAIVLG